MNFAFGFTEVSVLASVTALFHYGLQTGGPVVWFWGWVVSWAAITVVSFSMAEICSAYPSAGSVYHWSGQLAPARHAAIASYITGACDGAREGCVPGFAIPCLDVASSSCAGNHRDDRRCVAQAGVTSWAMPLVTPALRRRGRWH